MSNLNVIFCISEHYCINTEYSYDIEERSQEG